MKRIFTILIAFTLLVTFANAQKNVVYCTTLRSNPAANMWPENNDVIIQMLNADPNFNVTVVVLEEGGIDPDTQSAVDLSGYDVIILHDGLGSSDAFWKPDGAAALATLPAPTLYDKIYALQAGKAFTTSDGASTNAENVYNLTIVDGTSDLFKGIDVSSGVITAMKGGVADDGSTGVRGLQYNKGNVVPDNTLLAYPEGASDVTISFSDYAAGSTIDDATLQNRVIVLGYNVGVTRNTDYADKCALTAEGLTIWRNAIYMLAELAVPETLADFSFLATGIEKTQVESASAYAVSGGIRVPAESNASIYSISGKVVAKGITSDFVECPKGIYIVEIAGKTSKVLVTK
ncbi:hypothetical protein ACE01N_16870 [Saccharicrinis sp. FJH2]|uniref:hypothetical protein n=1 Tax=Saccharicrinis sp. FJH65 TaxID=3344659 RepID=UPI0035F4B488